MVRLIFFLIFFLLFVIYVIVQYIRGEYDLSYIGMLFKVALIALGVGILFIGILWLIIIA